MRLRAAFTLTLLPALLSAPRDSRGQTTRSQPAAPAASAATAVPALVPYSGVAIAGDSKPLADEVSMTFLIYKDEEGGEPLWTESQTAVVDSAGHYKVQLGAASLSGLPTDLFATGEARWLEVQIAGQKPQPRVLLASVPYALKAADAATLGGLPASAFALASGARYAGALTDAAGIAPDATSTVTTSGGTSGYLAKFSGPSSIVNSPVFISGANVGIGTTTPSVPLNVSGATVLDGAMTVNGDSTYNGSLVLPPPGTATASKAYNSQFIKIEGSAWNSSSKSVVTPRFEWDGEVGGNNTANPTITLNLLSSTTASSPTETGFHFNANGTMQFASGQTFPGTGSGTITGVTPGTGLTGGGTSGKVTLNVNTAQIPTLAGNNTFTGSNTFNASLYENNDVNIDNTNTNSGGISPGLRFGSASGEGMASQRASSGDNQYGLDFFTDYTRRISISEAGYVGIGTASAEGIQLKVVGGAEAGEFENNVSYDPAIFAANLYTAETAPVLETYGQNGVCEIDTSANLDCEGTLTGSAKNFKIDHPLDPANKYLVHASVESSELMNIYSGNVTTDELGVATVTLPDWFEAENGDFRYQLTTIGRDAHAWISQEITNRQFKISTNATNVKVSWQITAVRQDGYAKAHPLIAEQDKPVKERGFYRHPELFGQSKEKGIAWARSPEGLKESKARHDAAKPGAEKHLLPIATETTPKLQSAQLQPTGQ